MAKEKWAVYGEYGGAFTTLCAAKKCAKEASTYEDNNYESSVYLIEEGCSYIDYRNGKLIRDGWTIK